MPQVNAARAIKMQPRTLPCETSAAEELFGEELFNAVWVKADHDLGADDGCRRDTALVLPDELEDRFLISADIFFGELNSSSLEDRLNSETWRSTRLAEEYHLLRFGHGSSMTCSRQAKLLGWIHQPGPRMDYFGSSTYSISEVILAVFWSMPETEQYFSSERPTASSMALRETLPPIR